MYWNRMYNLLQALVPIEQKYKRITVKKNTSQCDKNLKIITKVNSKKPIDKSQKPKS